MTAGKAVLFTVVLLALLGGCALVRTLLRRYETAQSMFDAAIDEPPAPVILPETFTCLRCESKPAAPGKLWCTACVSIVDALPVEPIDRDLQASVARQPAGQQRQTGGDR